MSSQHAVVSFLLDPESYANQPESVDCIETHGAYIFLAGDTAIKIKRNVLFSYMDFSTLELRRRAILREFELNAPHAPEIYLRILTITRNSSGSFQLEGFGTPIEYAIQMRRFSQSALLNEFAKSGRLTTDVALQIADVVYSYHAAARPISDKDPGMAIAKVITEIGTVFDAHERSSDAGQRFMSIAYSLLERWRPLLRSRAQGGHLRRCHGDLHLRNIVMVRGHPVLFDALEFEEDLATIDTLYDLAFLLMDLDFIGQRYSANTIFNRYLLHSGSVDDLEALALMPLYLGLRAGIRGMVSLQRGDQLGHPASGEAAAVAYRYLEVADDYFTSASACLVAVGGLSGTGKTTLAALLAPSLGASPGALHFRTDLERKLMLGVGETDRLPKEHYTLADSRRVYSRIKAKAKVALTAGHSVIVDAVFSTPEERTDIEEIARSCGVRFLGLWLVADEQTMVQRVASRQGDASDATPEVVKRQLASETGPISWETINAGGSVLHTQKEAIRVLVKADLVSSYSGRRAHPTPYLRPPSKRMD